VELNKGYKQTEIGMIPESWSLTTVGEQFSIQLGKMLDSEKNTGVPKPYLGNSSVQWGRIDFDPAKLIKLTNDDLQKYKLRLGDLLVCEGGEVGRAAIWERHDECYYQKALHRLRPKNGYNTRFMLNILSRFAERGLLKNFVTQTSIAHLPKDKFEQLPIPLPSSPKEQETIANALSDADAYIESLEKLIGKKRLIKKGVMQELLTGQRRIEGFKNKWTKKSFGELFQFSGGYSASRDDLSDHGHPYLHYGDIHTSNKTYVDLPKEAHIIPKLNIPLSEASASSLLQHGDVVFVDASEDDEGTSKHVVIYNPQNKTFISGLHTIVAKARTNELDVNYRRFCFQSEELKKQFKFYAVGTKVSGVSKSNIAKINLVFPTIDEQKAIANFLIDIESEQEILAVKLQKARLLKQGMMQELLTGRIRLV